MDIGALLKEKKVQSLSPEHENGFALCSFRYREMWLINGRGQPKILALCAE